MTTRMAKVACAFVALWSCLTSFGWAFQTRSFHASCRSKDYTVASGGATQRLRASSTLSDLPTPPSKKGFLRRFRDLVGYLKNPDEFILNRSKELGPVFEIYLFFQRTVVVGGQENVKEFIRERESQGKVIYPSMPDSFLELHTRWGTLNLDSDSVIFQQARGLFKDILASPRALSYHTKAVEPMIDEYVENLVRRVKENPEQEFQIVQEVLELCLQVFSDIFSGKGLTEEQVQMFLDYNSGLLALSKGSTGFKKGQNALQALKAEMLERFRALDDPSINMDASGKFYHSIVSGREGFEDEDRVASATMLFIWAAYVECGSLMLDALALTQLKGQVTDDTANHIRDNVVSEFKQAKKSGLSQTDYEFWTTAMPYTTGVLRECLRLEPPGAGVPRFGTRDFELGGYRIPASVPVMLDPRIGNMDPDLYEESSKFEPFRWTPQDNTVLSEGTCKCPFTGSALKLGPGSWFPGGNGAHKCPGIPLAEIVSAMFLAKVSEKLTWEFSGSGLTKDGEINYVRIPIKILPSNFGFYFKQVPETGTCDV